MGWGKGWTNYPDTPPLKYPTEALQLGLPAIYADYEPMDHALSYCKGPISDSYTFIRFHFGTLWTH